MTELEARKRALIAESEAYRLLLDAEVRLLIKRGGEWRQRLRFLSPANPWTRIVAPLAMSVLPGLLAGRRLRQKSRFGKFRLLGLLWKGWQLYRRFAPVFQELRTHSAQVPPAATPRVAR